MYEYPHFDMTEKVSDTFYTAIGRTIFCWSQVEGTIFALTSVENGVPWLDALAKNMRKNSDQYNFTEIIKKLIDKLKSTEDGSPALNALAAAEKLFRERGILVHGVWGIVYNTHGRTLGLLNWSKTDISNFRPVTLEQLSNFAEKCISVRKVLFEHVLPALHGAHRLSVDDDDGLVKLGA